MRRSNFSVEDLLSDESFQRWAYGGATDEEQRYWDAWVRERMTHEQTAREARQILAHLDVDMPGARITEEEIEAEWHRLRRRLAREEQAARPAHRIGMWMPSLSRMAAAVLLLVLAAGLVHRYINGGWPFSATKTLATAVGERATLTLPDGSVVILNASSSLTYSRRAGPAGRRVRLQGEAFFDITRQPGRHPEFVVQTDQADIRVMGTRFNVLSTDDLLQVSLNEGRVRVEASAGTGPIDLRPGELAELLPSKPGIAVREVNADAYSSWTGPRLLFDDMPFHEIAGRLERMYGLQIEVMDSTLMEVRVQGSVENDPDVVLEGLSRLLQRPVRRQGRRVVIE